MGRGRGICYSAMTLSFDFEAGKEVKEVRERESVTGTGIVYEPRLCAG